MALTDFSRAKIFLHKPRHIEEFRAYKARCEKNGWNPVWVQLCEVLLNAGYHVAVYDSKSTVSKYITASEMGKPGKQFKIRISNHAPVPGSPNFEPSDFYVGKNLPGKKWNTWQDAIAAVNEFFGRPV